jgi:pyrimidine-nucleoside phosphorylase
MNPAKIISAKRDGQRIPDEELAALIRGYAGGRVPDCQMAAFSMAVYFQGMQPGEIVTLTREMRDSGQVMEWRGLDKPVVDKHSTGGIGDKISIPLAPMLAACGLAVPMISGRGLGPTGGTLDKLESIPGFCTDLSVAELQTVVREVGCVITGTTDAIAPADRKWYALRDVTGTVPSVPLITGSILGKKLSEGLDALVLDVKWGSGSFMKTLPQAEELAASLVSVATQLGVRTTALLTDMNQPLGAVGNAVELNESIDILQNNVDADTITLIVALGAELLLETGVAGNADEAISRLSTTIRSGAAFEVFERMVAAQGGDLAAPRPIAKEHVIEAPRKGYVMAVDSEALGWAVIEMGGGRKQQNDRIDHATGLEWLAAIGRPVDRGQPLMSVYCSDEQFARLEPALLAACRIGDQAVPPPNLIVKRLTQPQLPSAVGLGEGNRG